MLLRAVKPRLGFGDSRLCPGCSADIGGQFRGVGVTHPLAPLCSGSLPSSPGSCDGDGDVTGKQRGPFVLLPRPLPSQGWCSSNPHFTDEEVQPQRTRAGSCGLAEHVPTLGCLLSAAGLQLYSRLRARTTQHFG